MSDIIVHWKQCGKGQLGAGQGAQGGGTPYHQICKEPGMQHRLLCFNILEREVLAGTLSHLLPP